jgi:tRNA A-37 threonylcarbamoyl transferase component Bud32
MGAVYLAIDTRLNRKLALKVMLPRYAADRAARERFLREARAAAQISHDNVVTVYEADERNGVPYIAMQFLQGYPLDEYLTRKGHLSIPQVVRLGREAALGLAAAHKIGLVHRDVKPGNLWLEAPNGRVKVLDFGLAKPVDAEVEVTGSGVVVGTPAYMSPEQARGEKVDARADLFSLGAVLYRLCAGRLPFEGPNVMAVLTALAVENPRPVRELNPAVPEPLADLTQQLLAKDPAGRPQSGDDVARRLRAIGEDLAVPTALAADGPGGSGTLHVTAVPEANPFADLDAAVDEPDAPSASNVRASRGPSRRWVWVTGATVLVAAGGVVGVVATKNRGTEPKNEPPEPVVGANGDKAGKPSTPTSSGKAPVAITDPDRVAARWVLSVDGMVRVNGERREIRSDADLPKGRFTLSSVDLFGRPVTDADLANLKGVTGLTELFLKGTRLTDAGLVHLKDHPRLRFLSVAGTEVTDAGLARLQDCQELEDLGLDATRVSDEGLIHLMDLKKLKLIWLHDTAVTDAGLAHLKVLSGLTRLVVHKTKVTAKGVAEFQAAVPGCKVEWDGGTVEPKK